MQVYKDCGKLTSSDLDIVTILERQRQCLREIQKLKKLSVAFNLEGIYVLKPNNGLNKIDIEVQNPLKKQQTSSLGFSSSRQSGRNQIQVNEETADPLDRCYATPDADQESGDKVIMVPVAQSDFEKIVQINTGRSQEFGAIHELGIAHDAGIKTN